MARPLRAANSCRGAGCLAWAAVALALCPVASGVHDLRHSARPVQSEATPEASGDGDALAEAVVRQLPRGSLAFAAVKLPRSSPLRFAAAGAEASLMQGKADAAGNQVNWPEAEGPQPLNSWADVDGTFAGLVEDGFTFFHGPKAHQGARRAPQARAARGRSRDGPLGAVAEPQHGGGGGGAKPQTARRRGIYPPGSVIVIDNLGAALCVEQRCESGSSGAVFRGTVFQGNTTKAAKDWAASWCSPRGLSAAEASRPCGQERLEARDTWFKLRQSHRRKHGLDQATAMELVAVKQSTTEDNRSLDQEARLLEQFHEPADVFVTSRAHLPDEQLLIMDYAGQGDLVNYVNNDGPLSDDIIVEFMSKLLRGLSAMHRRGFAHRDIKMDNLLVFGSRQHPTVRIGDFDLSCAVDAAFTGTGGAEVSDLGEHAREQLFFALMQHIAVRATLHDTNILKLLVTLGRRALEHFMAWHATTFAKMLRASQVCTGAAGTNGYIPPEFAEGQRDAKKQDVWAAGVVLYHLLWAAGQRRGLSVPLASDLWPLLGKLLDADPRRRCTAEECLDTLRSASRRMNRQRAPVPQASSMADLQEALGAAEHVAPQVQLGVGGRPRQEVAGRAVA